VPAFVPDRPSLDRLDDRWSCRWEGDIYLFDRLLCATRSTRSTPPTMSGDRHVGHFCFVTHTDFIARFQRMRGRKAFYPMGLNDNGLPTERRVQLRCPLATRCQTTRCSGCSHRTVLWPG
jgi:valyl-tRNA synthetase